MESSDRELLVPSLSLETPQLKLQPGKHAPVAPAAPILSTSFLKNVALISEPEASMFTVSESQLEFMRRYNTELRPPSPILSSALHNAVRMVSSETRSLPPILSSALHPVRITSESAALPTMCAPCSSSPLIPAPTYSIFADAMKRVLETKEKSLPASSSKQKTEEHIFGYSDEVLFNRANNRVMRDYQVSNCNKNCKYGQNCLFNINQRDVNELCEVFWGTVAPTSSERDARIGNIFDRFKPKSVDGRLSFRITHYLTETKTQDLRICEGAFLYAINLIPDNKTPSTAPDMWARHVKFFKNPEGTNSNYYLIHAAACGL